MAKSSAEYWADRVAAHTWREYNASEKDRAALKQLYEGAYRDIEHDLVGLFQKAEKGEITLTEGHTIRHLSGLKKDIEKIVSNLAQEEEKQLKTSLEKHYKSTYEGICKELPDASFSSVNQKAVEKALSFPWSGADFSDAIWKNKTLLSYTLNTALTRSLVRGTSMGALAKQIDGVMSSGYKNALRLARTETMHYLNDSALKAYKDAGVERVQFWAAEDERTCPECGALHGKEFTVGKAPILPIHPNCRCTYIPVVEVPVAEEPTKPSAVQPMETAGLPTNTEVRGHIATHYGRDEFDDIPDGRINQIMKDAGVSRKTAEQFEKDVQDYFGEWYMEVRAKETEHFAKVSDELDELIRLSPKYDGPISRGIGILETDADAYTIGAEIDMRGISSWTSDPVVSQSFSSQGSDKCKVIFQLDNPHTGSAMSHLSPYGLEESEVTLPSFARFEIVEVEKSVPTKTVKKVVKEKETYTQEYMDFWAEMDKKYGKDKAWSSMNDEEFAKAEKLDYNGVISGGTKEIIEEVPTGELPSYIIKLKEKTRWN